MSNQLELFPQPQERGEYMYSPALSDPDSASVGKFQRPEDAAETQRAAAIAIYPHTGTARRRVLDMISGRGGHGATDEEIQRDLELNPSTQRPRRVELVEGNWIEDSGRRRLTLSGRSAVVWVLTEQGQGAAR